MKRTPLRVKIPAAIREQLADDPYMKKCIVRDGYCEGRIEWNHAFQYASKRQNELWCILPMCTYHHRRQASHRDIIDKNLRHRIIRFDAEASFKEKYPRSNLLPTLKVDIIKR